MVLSYKQALFIHVSQTAICNRHHTVAERLCRWLLVSLDRTSGATLTMTQETLGNMLGVRREGVTEAALKLRRHKAIDYKRGKIEVINRSKLEENSCECYQAVKTETGRLLHYLPQHPFQRQRIANAASLPKVITVPLESSQGLRSSCVSRVKKQCGMPTSAIVSD